MTNIKKIVPVVAASAVIAGMTSMTAYAAEIDAEAVDTTPAEPDNTVVENQPAAQASTDISEVIYGEGTSSEPVENEDGSTTTTTEKEGLVNPDSEHQDEDGTIVMGDGILNNETDTTVSEETPGEGSTTTTTTTNPDGSTTTTTTTETETTTTEDNTQTVGGDVESSEASDVTEDEKKEIGNEVKDDIEGALEKGPDENGNYQIPSLPDAKWETGEDADGNTTHTITFDKESNPNPSELNPEEVLKVLDIPGLTHDDAGYFYTKEDGTRVEVTVTDNSTESTTTEWTVTVTEKPVEVKPPVDDEGTVTVDGEKAPTFTIDDNSEFSEEEIKNILKNCEGKFVDGVYEYKDENTGKTYTVTYTPGNSENIENLSNEEIVKLLPADIIFDEVDGKFYKKIGEEKWELTFANVQEALTKDHYSISVEETTPVHEEIDSDDLAVKTDKVKKETILNAINEARKEASLSPLTDTECNCEVGQDGSWTITLDGTTYFGTVNVTDPDADGNITATANASFKIFGEWKPVDETKPPVDVDNDNLSVDEVRDIIYGWDEDGTNNFTLDGGKVTDVKNNYDGTHTIVTEKHFKDDTQDVTEEKTYTITYTDWEYGEHSKDNYEPVNHQGDGQSKEVAITGDYFFCKQATGCVIWVADRAGRTDTQIIESCGKVGGMKDDNYKIVTGNGRFDFSDLVKGDNNIKNTYFVVENGKVTFYGPYSHATLGGNDKGSGYDPKIVGQYILKRKGQERKFTLYNGSESVDAKVAKKQVYESSRKGGASIGKYSGQLSYELSSRWDIQHDFVFEGKKTNWKHVAVEAKWQDQSTRRDSSVTTTTTRARGGEGGGEGGGTTTPTPPPTPADTTIDDTPTPLADLPEVETPAAETPAAETPSDDTQTDETTIEDTEVPLAEAPEELVELDDGPVPLADVPTTGDNFQSKGLFGLLSLAGLGWLALGKKRRND